MEYNKSNFFKVYNFLKSKYFCYFYNFDKNKLEKLTSHNILKLIEGKILEKKYKKNSVNIFFIKKSKNLFYEQI